MENRKQMFWFDLSRILKEYKNSFFQMVYM